MKMKEAIERTEAAHEIMRQRGYELTEEELLVLAAARAFSCETCHGRGKVPSTRGYGLYRCCPDCREDREKIMGT